jgi:hypothetical protein
VFSWRFLDGDGAVVGSSESFADRDTAEAWLGANWSSLHDRGVEDVELVDGAADAAVYRMSLAGE